MKRVFFSPYAAAIGCALALQVSATAIAKEATLHSFVGPPDGVYPGAGLIDVGGRLYGTTEYGGTNCRSGAGCGTVFAVNSSTGSETVLYSFCSQKKCSDGAIPDAGLIDVNGTLYGTTALGGGGANCQAVGGCGTVFALNPSTGAETVVYSFCNQQNCADGFSPEAGLIEVGGTLYGTTVGGGANCESNGSGGCGTVFALNPSSGKESALYSFCSQRKCRDGSEPMAGLIDVKGTLYGTTIMGGAYRCLGYGCGTLFAFDLKTGAETVVHSFGSSGTDGTLPFAGLIDVQGTLYGTTSEGGSSMNSGTVFSLDPTTGDETVLYAFCSQSKKCTHGACPFTSVIDVKGTLYGTTLNGGDYGGGVLFSLDPNTGAETVLHAFGSSGTDGVGPDGPLTYATRRLYGVTANGGTNDDGTVYKFRP